MKKQNAKPELPERPLETPAAEQVPAAAQELGVSSEPPSQPSESSAAAFSDDETKSVPRLDASQDVSGVGGAGAGASAPPPPPDDEPEPDNEPAVLSFLVVAKEPINYDGKRYEIGAELLIREKDAIALYPHAIELRSHAQ